MRAPGAISRTEAAEGARGGAACGVGRSEQTGRLGGLRAAGSALWTPRPRVVS